MPQPPATVTINGSTFTIPLIDPWESFLLAPELAPIVAEVLPALVDLRDFVAAAPDGKNVLDMDLAAFAPLLERLVPAVGRACAAMPRDKLDRLARTLLDGVMMDGKPLFTDTARPIVVLLRGQPLTIWRLLIASVRENFADFFGRRGASGSASQAGGPSAT